MEKAFQRVFEREFERVRKDYELGNLKEMPPSREMQGVQRQIIEANGILDELRQQDPAAHPELIALQEKVSQQLYILEQYYMALDIQRRVDIKLAPDEAVLPEPRTKWEKIQTFFISRGLLNSLNGATRALFLAGLILLVPSLTSIYSVQTAPILTNKIDVLNDLRLQINRKDWEAEKDSWGIPQRAKRRREGKPSRTRPAHLKKPQPLPSSITSGHELQFTRCARRSCAKRYYSSRNARKPSGISIIPAHGPQG